MRSSLPATWPGNIRELQNLVERAVILSRDCVLQNPLRKSQIERVIPGLYHTGNFYSSKTLRKLGSRFGPGNA